METSPRSSVIGSHGVSLVAMAATPATSLSGSGELMSDYITMMSFACFHTARMSSVQSQVVPATATHWTVAAANSDTFPELSVCVLRVYYTCACVFAFVRV